MTKAIVTVRLFDNGEVIDTHTIRNPLLLLGSASPQSYADALARLRQSQTGLPCYGTVASASPVQLMARPDGVNLYA